VTASRASGHAQRDDAGQTAGASGGGDGRAATPTTSDDADGRRGENAATSPGAQQKRYTKPASVFI